MRGTSLWIYDTDVFLGAMRAWGSSGMTEERDADCLVAVQALGANARAGFTEASLEHLLTGCTALVKEIPSLAEGCESLLDTFVTPYMQLLPIVRAEATENPAFDAALHVRPDRYITLVPKEQIAPPEVQYIAIHPQAVAPRKQRRRVHHSAARECLAIVGPREMLVCAHFNQASGHCQKKRPHCGTKITFAPGKV